MGNSRGQEIGFSAQDLEKNPYPLFTYHFPLLQLALRTGQYKKLHAQTYSQSYAADRKKTWSMWAKNFNQMAIKTVLKKLLKNWGILSSEMQTAIQADQSVIDQDSFTYVDNGGQSVSREIIDVPSEENSEPEFVNDETSEVLFAEENSTDTEISAPF